MKNFVARGLLGMAVLAGGIAGGCSKENGGSNQPEVSTGRMRMPLETTSASGKVYRLRHAVFSVDAIDGIGTASTTLRTDDDPSLPVLETFLRPGSFQILLADGWTIEQVDNLNHTSTPVPADLETSPFQFFDIRSNEESFVQYAFLVDGERVTFPPGRLIVGVGVTERGSTGGTDVRRSLLETHQDTVAGFSLEQALTAAQANSGLVPDPLLLYHELIDSYASAANARLPSAGHCGDETTDGQPSLNGYPLRCDRQERFQFDNLSRWFPTAVVNRLDLAPADGSNCGQQRLIFANNAQGRMFIIFEAQIPNPHPECGLAACQPLAKFWASLSQEPDGARRSQRLVEAFETGSAELLANGFRPFLTVENMSVGTGTVRTNNFDDGQWTLREFKLLSDPAEQTRVVEFPVSDAPHGALWDDTTTFPAGEVCRQSFLDALGGLASDDPAEMSFVVNAACLDAESPNDNFNQNYAAHLGFGSGEFRDRIAERIAGLGLTPENMADRARFAGSCIGCHEEATGTSLGHGVVSPFSNGFVQVDESFTENCGGTSPCFNASPALKDVFLPRRLRALNDLLALPSTCGGGSQDGGVVLPPPPGDGGLPPPPPVFADGGVGAVPVLPPLPAPPTSVLTPDETRDDLVKQDQAARDALAGQETLGGQSAQVQH